MTTTIDESMRNGVDTATLFATLDAVKSAPEAARFQFRTHNEWITGTHNRSVIHDYFGVGEERTTSAPSLRRRPPGRPGRPRQRPTPVEYVLHALAACLTAGLANIAAARGDPAHRGPLHRDRRHRPQRHPRSRPDVRNGYQNITVRFTVKGDAPAEKLRSSSSSPGPARPSSTSSPTRCPSRTKSPPTDPKMRAERQHRRGRCRPASPIREQPAAAITSAPQSTVASLAPPRAASSRFHFKGET
jgi:uncharacterized OsmC-like protein